MTAAFEPANELEHALVKARQGELPVVSFMDKLLASQVFVLLDKAPAADGKWDNGISPMVLRNQDGNPVMAMFTAPERSTEWPKREPRFQHGLLTDFAWLLRGLQPGVGLVINPGLAAGLEMPASGVAQLKQRAQRRN